MKTITVHTSRDYSVLIGADLMAQLGSLAARIQNTGKAAIISDSNVWPLYGHIANESLREAGFETVHYTFSAGEESKIPQTYLEILNFLARNHLTRTDIVVALGGGVVGDITGFAAATYLRGIAYIQVPTTLLAMVDSSVGGKTAIDLPVGKNLAGAFYQPALVLCDTDVLRSLPGNIFRDGCAEVIKYGILYDADLFAHLASNGLAFDRETVIARCVELKRNVVAEDEFDAGARQMLNLGHTIGHGIEAKSNYTVSHGCAVAAGMAIVARAAYKTDQCSKETVEQIENVLINFGLPVRTSFCAAELLESALSDKKRSGETINLIIPKAVGKCIISKTPICQLQSFIEAGL